MARAAFRLHGRSTSETTILRIPSSAGSSFPGTPSPTREPPSARFRDLQTWVTPTPLPQLDGLEPQGKQLDEDANDADDDERHAVLQTCASDFAQL
jgi:hypothetical protein